MHVPFITDEGGSVTAPSILDTPHGVQLAYAQSKGQSPGVVFLGGFKSDMTGTKALALEAHCAKADRSFIRFDYMGHGASSGRFVDGTIGAWLKDSLAVIDQLTDGPQILVGSSMGGWLALLVALARPQRLHGLVLIAPAPDFTERLMWDGFSDAVKQQIMDTGFYEQPSDYSDDPYIITRALIEDGRNHLLLDKPIPVTAPVRILQGCKDEDVPMGHALTLMDMLQSDDLNLCLSKSGDHRLSTPDDLARLMHAVDDLASR
ncbi:alpha/beta hydrolase [Iodidimonas gelatinilytica]|uniref:alpha/beta hydrolase n=1 Tax=Iodidimonas gelatinilytica TaxID=1236966 RepID=UPI0012309456